MSFCSILRMPHISPKFSSGACCRWFSKSTHCFWVFRSYCLYLVLQDFSTQSFFVFIHPWIRKKFAQTNDKTSTDVMSRLAVVPFSVHLHKGCISFLYPLWEGTGQRHSCQWFKTLALAKFISSSETESTQDRKCSPACTAPTAPSLKHFALGE